MPGEAGRLEASAAILEEAGVPARVYGGEEGSRRAGGRGFDAVLEYDAGGTLDPARLVRTLVGLSGASLLDRWPVGGVAPAGDGVRLEGPEGAAIEVPRALLALNAYLPRVLPHLTDTVSPVRAQMMATEPIAPVLDRPVYSHEGYFYIRQRWDGRVLVGGARHLHLEEEIGYEDTTTPALQDDLAKYLTDHFPAVAHARIDRRWSGTMGFSPDGLPVVGEVDGVPGAIYAGGFTGHGMGYSMRFGELLAGRLLGEGDEADDLFDVARLANTPAMSS
jgi:glycine/D-amino acid oxidase-like deaminating enzyme